MDKKRPELIILYGDYSKDSNIKSQRLINGLATCGYREYARKFGHIIYLSPQRIKFRWEHSIYNPEDVLKFINERTDSVVWSVKVSDFKDHNILSKIKNKKIYYSCCSYNRYNHYCDISLVDTEDRLKGVPNGVVWFKGKDPEYWKSSLDGKEFDYILVGGRGDKNEIYFIHSLNKISELRSILWVGGSKFRDKINSKHYVVLTDFSSQDIVRNYLGKAKVGILFTELKAEGFPQTFLEMTMCGVPVVYNKNAPINKQCFHSHNHIFTTKENLIESAETLLKNYNSELCRKEAIENYSIEKSYDWIIQCLK
jgi:hypothetical protein